MIKQFFISSLCIFALLFSSCSDDDLSSGPIDVIIDGATVRPNIGGPNQPNQVYIDLGSNTTKVVKRDTWDLGFYSGSDFRVVLNGSLYMAAAQLEATDIDAVNASSTQVKELQPKVAVGTFENESAEFVDAPNGDISKTAIAAVSSTDANNHVYLLNLGDEVGTGTPASGSAEVSGAERGWKKIRILRDGDGYLLQYADLDATDHKEIKISKKEEFHFAFFSFSDNDIVSVQPNKNQWDLNFTVFTNIIPGFGGYGYADFVVSNSNSNVQTYMIEVEDNATLTYDAFELSNVDAAKFENDQRSIGSTWRIGGGPDELPSLKANVFYIIKDTEGNLYKLKFIALTNEAGDRGYPQFVYRLLQ